jgi:hypothetical protein
MVRLVGLILLRVGGQSIFVVPFEREVAPSGGHRGLWRVATRVRRLVAAQQSNAMRWPVSREGVRGNKQSDSL